MSSLLVSNAHRIDLDTYSVPQSMIKYNGVKLRSASILNNDYTANGFVMTVRFLSVDIPLHLHDGYYNGYELASYMQTRLNQYSGNQSWIVTYNSSALRYNIQYVNTTSNPVTLKFNDVMKPWVGFTHDITFPGSATTFFESDTKVRTPPGYIRVVSHSLTSNSMAFDQQLLSGVVGIVPVTGKFGEYSVYDNADSFFIQTVAEQTLYNQIDLHFYIEDTFEELADPIFHVNFQFI